MNRRGRRRWQSWRNWLGDLRRLIGDVVASRMLRPPRPSRDARRHHHNACQQPNEATARCAAAGRSRGKVERIEHADGCRAAARRATGRRRRVYQAGFAGSWLCHRGEPVGDVDRMGRVERGASRAMLTRCSACQSRCLPVQELGDFRLRGGARLNQENCAL